jgi:hypothetical protein
MNLIQRCQDRKGYMAMSDFDVDTSVKRCVRDVLYLQRFRQDGCFMTDLAAIELETYGAPVCSMIEAIIREDVVPHVISGADRVVLQREFLGLTGLWMSYFQIGGPEYAARAAAFLRSLPRVLQVTAILAAQNAFKTKPRQASELEIFPEIWDALKGLEKSSEGENGAERELIARILGSFERSV